jgi:hypothetical protein
MLRMTRIGMTRKMRRNQGETNISLESFDSTFIKKSVSFE